MVVWGAKIKYLPLYFAKFKLMRWLSVGVKVEKIKWGQNKIILLLCCCLCVVWLNFLAVGGVLMWLNAMINVSLLLYELLWHYKK